MTLSRDHMTWSRDHMTLNRDHMTEQRSQYHNNERVSPFNGPIYMLYHIWKSHLHCLRGA